MEQIKIYDRAFAEVGVSADWTFLEYSKEFRGAGSASLVFPITSSAAELCVPEGFVKVPDGEMYIIRSLTKDMRKGEVTVECEGLLSLFSGTATAEEFSVSGAACAILGGLVRRAAGNTPASLSIESSSEGKSVTYSGGRAYLYDDMVSLCYLGNVGMSLRYEDGKLVFTPLSIRDRSASSEDPVIVSRSLGGFGAEEIKWDYSGYKNVAVISGAEKDSGGRYTVTVRSDSLDISDSFSDSEYFDRQMLVTFSASLSAYMKTDSAGEKYFDESAYTSAMALAGAAALGRCRPRLCLYGSADNADILPGDLVEVTDGTSGISGTATAERVVTTYSDGMKKIMTELVSENVLGK